MEQTDSEVLLACRRGEEEAWETLVGRYQRLIYSIARRAGLDRDLSAEVFQEVFTTLVQNLDQIEHPERLPGWLITTARRQTWRLLKRQSPSLNRLVAQEASELEMEMVFDDSPLPDEVLIQMEQQHRVQRAVGELDDRCRKLLTLLFYRHPPPAYSEIAATLKTPESSIGPTRARCLKKLLRLLEK
jgi:RNA polymerase sigma factor (sigma-70 family)